MADSRVVPGGELAPPLQNPPSGFSFNISTETLTALFRLETGLGAATANKVPSEVQNRGARLNPDTGGDFNPCDHIKGYERRKSAFALTKDLDEIAAVKAQIDMEEQDEETKRAAGPLGQGLGVLIGFGDPFNFVPFAGATNRAIRSGKSLLKTSAKSAAAGFGSSAVAQKVLQDNRLTLEPEDSAIDIGVNTLIGAALGPLGQKTIKSRSGDKTNLPQRVEDDVTVQPDPIPDRTEAGGTVELKQKGVEQDTVQLPRGTRDASADRVGGIRGLVGRLARGETKGNVKDEVDLGPVTPELSARIAEAYRAAGRDPISLEGFRFRVDAGGVRHAKNSHGDPAKEATRGQIAVTDEDFELIPQIIDNPDDVKFGGVTRKGLDVVIFEKTIGDKLFFAVQVRTGRRSLSLATMFKQPSRPIAE